MCQIRCMQDLSLSPIRVTACNNLFALLLLRSACRCYCFCVGGACTQIYIWKPFSLEHFPDSVSQHPVMLCNATALHGAQVSAYLLLTACSLLQANFSGSRCIPISPSSTSPSLVSAAAGILFKPPLLVWYCARLGWGQCFRPSWLRLC